MQTQTFSISGISCGSCVAKISSVFELTEAFDSTEVLRSPDRIKVNSENGVTKTELNHIFEENGLGKYKATDLSEEIAATTMEQDGLLKMLLPLA